MRSLPPILFALLAACSSEPPKPAAKQKPEPIKPEILQFYVSPNPIPPGVEAQLCWGTQGADKLALEPAVDQIKPSLARCIEVSPKATTTYSLTATSKDGIEVHAQATLTVDAKAATGGSRAVSLLQTVTFSALSVKAGEPVSICADNRGAASVTLDPGGIPFPKGAHACLVSTFTRTTNVTITARGPGGASDRESATITVR